MADNARADQDRYRFDWWAFFGWLFMAAVVCGLMLAVLP